MIRRKNINLLFALSFTVIGAHVSAGSASAAEIPLVKLDARDCAINSITGLGSTNGVRSLQMINLGNNNLTSFNYTTVNNTVTSLNLRGNSNLSSINID